MKPAFADTGYWIALLHSGDMLHNKASALTENMPGRQIVTTEMVLTEFLNNFAGMGLHLRMAAVRYAEQLNTTEDVIVYPQTSEQYMDAMRLYRQRPDKEWSLTDCASILLCQQEGITEVLTHDHHFEQAGLTALLRNT